MLRDLPPDLTSVGIYLNGEYSTGQLESIGYHNYSQIGVMLPQRSVNDLPASVFHRRAQGDFRLFICHAKRDRSLVEEILRPVAADLRSVDTWLDESRLASGAPIEETIADVVGDSTRIVIAFLSYSSLRSDWVQRELSWAIEAEQSSGRISVIVVALDEGVLDDLDDAVGDEVADYLRSKRVEQLTCWRSAKTGFQDQRKLGSRGGVFLGVVRLAAAPFGGVGRCGGEGLVFA